MKKPERTKGKKKCSGGLYFLAFGLLTAAVVVVTIIEGNRIKKENELLEYEVW